MIFVALSILRVIIRAYLIIMIIRMVADWLFVLVPRMRPRGANVLVVLFCKVMFE